MRLGVGNCLQLVPRLFGMEGHLVAVFVVGKHLSTHTVVIFQPISQTEHSVRPLSFTFLFAKGLAVLELVKLWLLPNRRRSLFTLGNF